MGAVGANLLCLALKEHIRKIPESRLVDALYSQCSFVKKRRCRVPWLHLLAENHLHLVRMFISEVGDNVLQTSERGRKVRKAVGGMYGLSWAFFDHYIPCATSCKSLLRRGTRWMIRYMLAQVGFWCQKVIKREPYGIVEVNFESVFGGRRPYAVTYRKCTRFESCSSLKRLDSFALCLPKNWGARAIVIAEEANTVCHLRPISLEGKN